MHYTVVRLGSARIAAVLVGRSRLYDDNLITQLQRQLERPVMLLTPDSALLEGFRAYAEFDTGPALLALLAREQIEWSQLPDKSEPDPPF